MTSELRPAMNECLTCKFREPLTVERAAKAADITGDTYVCLSCGQPFARPKQAAEIAKFKALAETLAFMLEAGTRFMPSSATVWHREAAKALRQYKEARDAS